MIMDVCQYACVWVSRAGRVVIQVKVMAGVTCGGGRVTVE